MNLEDERLHRRRVPWASLTKDGFNPREIMLEAQRLGLWKLAHSARCRLDNEKRGIAE